MRSLNTGSTWFNSGTTGLPCSFGCFECDGVDDDDDEEACCEGRSERADAVMHRMQVRCMVGKLMMMVVLKWK